MVRANQILWTNIPRFNLILDHYIVMDLDELQELQENLLQQIWMLTLENDIYERYLSRQDPHSLKGKE